MFAHQHQKIGDITFTVNKIYYYGSDKNFIIRANDVCAYNNNLAGRTYTVKGTIDTINEGDTFEAQAILDMDNHGRETLLVNELHLQFPSTRVSLENFFVHYVKGVGKVKAHAIIQELGLDAIEKILHNPNVLENVVGIKGNLQNNIYQTLLEKKVFQQLLSFLSTHNLPARFANEIYALHNRDALKILQYNPYILQTEVTGQNFILADQLAVHLDKPADNPERLYAAMDFALNLIMQQGHTCFIREKFFNLFLQNNRFFKHYSAYPNYQINQTMFKQEYDKLVRLGKLIEVPQDGQIYIYLTQYFQTEQNCLNKILELVKHKTTCDHIAITKFIQKYENHNHVNLSQEQKDGIPLTIENGLSIITGGPGTGKTELLKVLTQYLKANNKKVTIQLTAPTGKAAQHMSEIIKLPASTLHSALGLFPGEHYAYHKNTQQITADYLICDEASMLDIFLFEDLLQALKITNHTHLILVGDYHQLPSVGSGLILKDLIDSQIVATIKLEQIFRNTGCLVTNAQAIKKGIGFHNNQGQTVHFNDNNASFFIEAKDIRHIKAYLIACVRKLLRNYSWQDILILSPQRINELGTNVLNNLIQSTFNPHYHITEQSIKVGSQRFFVGDKVIQTVNDRNIITKSLDSLNNEQQITNINIGIMNGTVGYIQSIFTDPNSQTIKVNIQFGNKIATYTKTKMREIELGYCLTVHKSQGSEAANVLQIIDTTQARMLDRTSIYTGFTRSKQRNIIIGQVDVFNEAIKKENNTRITLLKKLLQQKQHFFKEIA